MLLFFIIMPFLLTPTNYIPYRDILTLNMPGTYTSHLLFGKLFGFDNNGLIITHYVLSFTILCLTILASYRKFGLFTSIFSGLFFLLLYQAFGSFIFAQREIFVIAYISFIFFINHINYSHNSKFLFYVLVLINGILLGQITLIKPQFILFIIPILFVNYYNYRSELKSIIAVKRFLIKVVFPLILGLSLIILIHLVWILSNGGYEDLYVLFSKSLKSYTNFDLFYTGRFIDIYFKIDGIFYVLFLSLLGFIFRYIQLKDSRHKNKLIEIFLFFFISILIPFFSNKHFLYHYIPAFYFSGFGLAFFVKAILNLKRLNVYKKYSLLLVSVVLLSINFVSLTRVDSWQFFEINKAKEINEFIQSNQIKSNQKSCNV